MKRKLPLYQGIIAEMEILSLKTSSDFQAYNNLVLLGNILKDYHLPKRSRRIISNKILNMRNVLNATGDEKITYDYLTWLHEHLTSCTS